MAYTYSKIATVTVGSGGVSSIDFLAIPQNYTDLVLKLSLKSNNTSGGENVWIRFNGDSGANYATRRLYGSGTGTASDTGGTTTYINAAEINDSIAASANAFGNAELYIPNYTLSTFKSVSADAVMEANQTTIYMGINAGVWNSTAAITSIAMTVQVGTLFVINSTATLYGIKAEV